MNECAVESGCLRAKVIVLVMGMVLAWVEVEVMSRMVAGDLVTEWLCVRVMKCL